MTVTNFKFISSIVKGLLSSKKRLKVFEALRNKICPSGKWNGKFKWNGMAMEWQIQR